jgi:hypothetical protein
MFLTLQPQFGPVRECEGKIAYVMSIAGEGDIGPVVRSRTHAKPNRENWEEGQLAFILQLRLLYS